MASLHLCHRRRSWAALALLLLISTASALSSAGCDLTQDLALMAEIDDLLSDQPKVRSIIKDVEWTVHGKNQSVIEVFTKLNDDLRDPDTVLAVFQIAKTVYVARAKVRGAPGGKTYIRILSASKKLMLSADTQQRFLWEDMNECTQTYAKRLVDDLGDWMDRQPNPQDFAMTGVFVEPCWALRRWPYPERIRYAGFAFVNPALRNYLRKVEKLDDFDEYMEDVGSGAGRKWPIVVFLCPTPEQSGPPGGPKYFHSAESRLVTP